MLFPSVQTEAHRWEQRGEKHNQKQDLAERADQACRYSNATRGNIDVTITDFDVGSNLLISKSHRRAIAGSGHF